ncbi:MAG: Dyp-type peroxidase [Pseudoclavibacter sp.]|nr:Dyp-type peroxidase [Pseudoclavibacter sp.]
MLGAGLLALGAAAGAGGAFGVRALAERTGPAPAAGDAGFGGDRLPFHGPHQAGVSDVPGAHAVYLALDLAPGTDREGVRTLLRLLSDDAARLTAGVAPVADQEPELARDPARLTITFGFGPGLVERVDPAVRPAWLAPLPAFPIDRLEERWCDGDLLLAIGSDDPLALAHARRMLLKDARAFTVLRWTQEGFRNARGTGADGRTQRNLFGQLDGTAQPSGELDDLVWIGPQTPGAPAWLLGGTSFVLRRIRMDMEGWDVVDRPGREAAIGRRLDTGAPLTGAHEHDEPDFEARTRRGFTVIHPASHLRRARSDEPRQRILRRTHNYDVPVSPGAGGRGAAVSDSGLLFGSFQQDVTEQFLPIQERLAEADLLNSWTVPVGSAVFAIPPGCGPGGFVGETLFGEPRSG